MYNDLRFAFRMLAKHPGPTAVVLVSLALGIGGNVAIFSFVNALLLRPPAVEAPHELLEVWNLKPKAASAFERYSPLSYPGYSHFRDHNESFSGLLAFDGDTAFVSWSRDGQGKLVQGQCVSGNFFSLLGVKPSLGRTFLPEEDRTSGTHPVTVLSHTFWREQLASDPNVLGTALTLNGLSYTVVGVAPASFTGMMVGIAPDFWTPLMMAPQIFHDAEWLTRHGSFSLLAMGRLKQGASVSQATAEIGLLANQLSQEYRYNKDLSVALFPATLVPGPFRGFVGAFMALLMVVTLLVLLIACANAANFLLAQATSRRRELVIRTALGASRARIFRQALTESVLLAILGGAVGMLFALWANQLLLQLKPATLPIRFDLPLDARVFAFTFLMSLLTGLVFGLVPALRGTRFDLTPTLKDEAHGSGYRKSRFRNGLIVSQIALCLVLLIGGALCLRSLFNAQSVDPGFQVRNRLSAKLDLQSLDYSTERGKRFYRAWVERVEALPGVQSASLAGYLPLETTSRGMEINVDGRQPSPDSSGFGIDVNDVGPNYFKTMGTLLLRGREFTSADNDSAPRVAIVNEAMAERFWPGHNPLGRRVFEGPSQSNQSYEVVGVVKTGRYRTLSEAPRPFLFRALLQHYHSKATLVAHTDVDSRQLVQAVQDEVRKLDSNLALIQLGTLEQHLSFALFPARVTGLLLGVSGLLGLILAVVGLSGVIAYSVSQRTHEIGVRMALGAQQRDVFRLVVGQGVALALVGIAIGLFASVLVTHVLAGLLYGIQPTDPLTFVAVPLVMASVALLACYIPAQRAAKVDPMVALRYE